MKKPPRITLRKVKSSMATHSGYDAKTETLRVKYASGAVHDYYGVDAEAAAALEAADSFGQHFNQCLKPFHESKKVNV